MQNRISCIDKDDMIYLDNAATSRFKPKCVLDALIFDVTHSANSGRAGHDEAIDKSIRIQNVESISCPCSEQATNTL